MNKLSFVCLNVEPDSDVEEEVDDSAELQVWEEGILYHNVLTIS